MKENSYIFKELTKGRQVLPYNYFMMIVLNLLKYWPLIIVTDNWAVSDDSLIINALSIKSSLQEFTMSTFIDILVILIFLLSLIPTLILYSKLKVNSRTDLQVFKKSNDSPLNLIKFIFYFSFCLNTVWIYILGEAVCHYNYLSSGIYSGSSFMNTYTFSPEVLKRISMGIAAITVFLQIFINYFLQMIYFSPFLSEKDRPYVDLNSSRFEWIAFPHLLIFFFIEKNINIEIYVYIKLVYRILYVIYYLISLKNHQNFQDYFAIFFKSFAFVSCLIEFGFLQNYIQLKQSQITTNFDNLSSLNDSNFRIVKYLLQILVAIILTKLIHMLEHHKSLKFLTDQSNKNFFYNFSKFFDKLYKYENNMEFIKKISLKIVQHKDKCTNESCHCYNINRNDIFKEINNVDSQFRIIRKSKVIIKSKDLLTKQLKSILSFFFNEIKLGLKKYEESSNKKYCQFLLLETLYYLHFEEHYFKCLFNIKKIKTLRYYKRNSLIRFQVNMLKIEVIERFMRNNQTSSIYAKVRVAFNLFNKYKYCEEKILETIRLFRSIITLFYNNNITYNEFKERSNKFLDAIEMTDLIIKEVFNKNDLQKRFYMSKVLYFYSFFFRKNYFKDILIINPLNLIDKEDDQSEKIMIKIENDNFYKIIYVTPLFAETLGYKMNYLIGKDMHDFMSVQICQPHKDHVYRKITDNYLNVRYKKIYYLNKLKQLVPFEVTGSFIATIENDLMIFAKLNFVSNMKKTCLCFTNSLGHLMSVSKHFEKKFFLNEIIYSKVEFDFIKNILKIPLNEIPFQNNKYNTILTYSELIKNLNMIDFNNLLEYNKEIYSKLIYNIKNVDTSDCTVNITLKKSVLNGEYVFYIIEFVFSNNHLIPTNISKKINMNLDFYSNLESLRHNSIEQTILLKDINKKINLTSVNILKMKKRDFEGDLNEIAENQEKLVKPQKKKEKKSESDMPSKPKLKKSIFLNLIFCVSSLILFYFLYYYIVSIFEYIYYLIGLSLNILMVGQQTYYISNNCLLIMFQRNKYLSNFTVYDSQSFNDNLTIVRNDLKDLVVEYQTLNVNMREIFSNLSLGDQKTLNTILFNNLNITDIGYSWELYSKNISFYDFMLMFSWKALQPVTTVSPFIYNPTTKTYLLQNGTSIDNSNPRPGDQSIILIIENLIQVFNYNLSLYYNGLINIQNSYYSSIYLYTIIFFALTALIVLAFYIVNFIFWYHKLNKAFEKSFIVHNKFLFFKMYLLQKIELIEEFFSNYTYFNSVKIQNYSAKVNDDLLSQKCFITKNDIDRNDSILKSIQKSNNNNTNNTNNNNNAEDLSIKPVVTLPTKYIFEALVLNTNPTVISYKYMDDNRMIDENFSGIDYDLNDNDKNKMSKKNFRNKSMSTFSKANNNNEKTVKFKESNFPDSNPKEGTSAKGRKESKSPAHNVNDTTTNNNTVANATNAKLIKEEENKKLELRKMLRKPKELSYVFLIFLILLVFSLFIIFIYFYFIQYMLNATQTINQFANAIISRNASIPQLIIIYLISFYKNQVIKVNNLDIFKSIQDNYALNKVTINDNYQKITETLKKTYSVDKSLNSENFCGSFAFYGNRTVDQRDLEIIKNCLLISGGWERSGLQNLIEIMYSTISNYYKDFISNQVTYKKDLKTVINENNFQKMSYINRMVIHLVSQVYMSSLKEDFTNTKNQQEGINFILFLIAVIFNFLVFIIFFVYLNYKSMISTYYTKRLERITENTILF